jgi:hypothetical protein
MGLLGLIVMFVGFLGVVLSFFNIVIHAYKEQGPLWGLLCLPVPSANLVWGIVHWQDDDARRLFLRYLGYSAALVFGLILMKAWQ